MIIVKNAFRNMIRNKGRNILIGIIITIITLCTCIALAIHQAGVNLVQTYKQTNPLAISFSLNMNELRNASDEEKNDFQSLTVDDVNTYGDSELVKDYYYTLEASLSSSDVEVVNDNVRPEKENKDVPDEVPGEDASRGKTNMGNIGDFRITAYSNFSYLSDFVDGNKQIVAGVMITGDSDEDEIVISQSLAEDNDLEVGDEITFYLPSDEDTTYTFTIVGIFETEDDSNSSDFMNMNVLNSSNQIYANVGSVEKILEDNGSDDSQLVATNGLSAIFYLYDNDDLEKFEAEVKDKGLSDYYSVSTNEEEVNQQLQPIQNIVNFSVQFLVVVLIIGVFVLTVINVLNIRDRKYEIGVLRAIGMSKFKVTSLFILEIFFITLISFTLGATSGTLLAQPVTNTVLENEINSYTESITNTQNNFGGDGFNRPSQDIGEQSPGDNTPNNQDGKDGSLGRGKEKISSMQSVTNYVDSLTVHISAVTIIELFGISILLIVGSSIVSCLYVNKYNPNTILQNRN